MIKAIDIENFRGIEKLRVDGLGRVNLITGHNNCGKTALLEALLAGQHPEGSAELLALRQLGRGTDAEINDFENFWRPMFWNGVFDQGLSITIETSGGRRSGFKLWHERTATIMRAAPSESPSRHDKAWKLRYESHGPSGKQQWDVTPTDDSVAFPPGLSEAFLYPWTSGGPHLSAIDIGQFSMLKQTGGDAVIVEMLGHVDPAIGGLEILAPTGLKPTIFVRFRNRTPMLSLQMIGEGVQRCFEIALSAATSEKAAVYLDEMENGIHHSAVEPIWRWIAEVSAKRNLQVFVTTHSDECVSAACAAFAEATDDALRVVRLARRDGKVVASVYDRRLIEVAERNGVDLRG